MSAQHKDQMPPLPWEDVEHGYDIAAWIEVRSDDEIGVAFHAYARAYAAELEAELAQAQRQHAELLAVYHALAARQPVEAEPVRTFARWAMAQAKSDWYGRTVADMVETYLAAPQPATVKAQPLGWAWERRYSNGGYTREFKVDESEARAMTEHFGEHSGTYDMVYPFFSGPVLPATVKAEVTDEQIAAIWHSTACKYGRGTRQHPLAFARALLAQQGVKTGAVDRDAVLEEAALAVEQLYNDSAYQHGNRNVSLRVAGEQSAYEAAEDAIRALKGKPVATPPTGEARDAARINFMEKNPQISARWRIKSGKEQWQVVDDGEPSGKWHNSLRAALDSADAALHQEKQQKGGTE